MKNSQISSSVQETGLPFIRVPHAIIRGGHKPQFLAVLCVLLSRSSSGDDNGWCYASRETIAKDAGVSLSTVQRALNYWRKAKIEGFEMIEKKQRKREACQISFKINYAKTRQIPEESTGTYWNPEESTGTFSVESTGTSKENPYKKRENNNKPAADAAGSQDSVSGKQVNEIMNVFISKDPFLKFSNLTQRKASLELINQIGFDKALAACQFALDLHGVDYAPQIHSPLELLKKFSKLKGYKPPEVKR